MAENKAGEQEVWISISGVDSVLKIRGTCSYMCHDRRTWKRKRQKKTVT